MTRAFIALEIPEPMSGTIAALQVGLEFGRLVPQENFHVTLAFLGDQSDLVLDELHAGLSLLSAPAFDVQVQGLGTFGDMSPHHLFAEVVPSAELAALRKKVRHAARDAGIELSHQRFHPHITIARFGRGAVGEELTALREHIARRMGLANGTFRATRFTLFESRLSHAAPVYVPLAHYHLTPYSFAT